MSKIDDKVAYLDDERKKIWAKIIAIEKKQFIADNELLKIELEVKNKTSDYEAAAKQSSKMASEFRNKTEESKNTTLQYFEEVKQKIKEIDVIHTAAEELRDAMIEFHNNSIVKHDEIETIYSEINEQNELISQNIVDLNAMYTSIPTYAAKIEKLDSVLSESENYLLKNEALYKSIASKKKEIDELYYEIIGFTDKDEKTGEDIEVAGLKEELETAYDQLEINITSIKKDISELINKTVSDYNNFITDSEANYNIKSTNWDYGYSKSVKSIEDLLPNALTAGLSHAYSIKKDSEIGESEKIAKKFDKSIIGLICVSLIPFGISIVSWLSNKDLDKVLLEMPRLVLSILPLYVPVLWLAYSANKSLKLSKRLIEEYTHKEVLSKTFEGLSKQIENIEDKDISFDLRTKLLYNILEVNAENPGKLITDYNKSDHPLMDALDKSFKLANAVDKLADIPGLSRLADVLDKRSKRKLKEEQEKANEAFDSLPKIKEDDKDAV